MAAISSGSMTFRVDPELQAQFVARCKDRDVTAAQVLRKAMRDYLDRNPQAELPLSGASTRKGKSP